MRHWLSSWIRLYGRHAPTDLAKDKLAWWAFSHLRPLPSPVSVPLGSSLRIEIDPNDFVQSQIFYLGLYEHKLATFFMRLIKPGTVFCDVGAHIGQYSLLAAALGARVHAFEPYPPNFKRLKHNVDANQLRTIAINAVAVGESKGSRTMILADESNTASAALVLSATGAPRETTVPSISLDDYFNSVATGPSLVKIDVEGSEMSVLLGAQGVIEEYHPTLIMEVWEPMLRALGHSGPEIVAFLESHGYQLFSLEGTQLRAYNQTLNPLNKNVICLRPA